MTSSQKAKKKSEAEIVFKDTRYQHEVARFIFTVKNNADAIREIHLERIEEQPETEAPKKAVGRRYSEQTRLLYSLR